METLNPEDNNTIQIQSVDNIVSEIREIADNLYKDVSNPSESNLPTQNPIETHKSPQTSQTNFSQSQSSEIISREPQAPVENKLPTLNANDLSKGLSRLHSRVDEVLRGAGNARKSQLVDQNLVNSTIQAIKARQSAQPNPEASEQTRFTNPTNYSSIPRTSSQQRNEPAGGFPTSQMNTGAPPTIITEPQYNNPFENAINKPGHVESRRSMLQDTNRTAETQSYHSNLTSQLSPSALSFVQSNYFSANPNLLRPSQNEKPVRALPLDGPITRPFVPESGLNVQNTNFQSPINTRQSNIPQGIKPATTISPFSTTPNPLSASTLQPSASTQNLKTNYDKSKLDAIISGIKARESGVFTPSIRPPSRDANIAPLTQSNFLSPTSAAAFMKTQEPNFIRTQEPDTKKLRASSTFAAPEIANQNYNSVEPLKQSKIDFISPRTVQTQQPNLSYSRMMLSPGQFQAPQNLLSPNTQAHFPSNPFNQPRASRIAVEEPNNDYYGILQAQNEPERLHRQKLMSPGAPVEAERYERDFYQSQPQMRTYQQQQQYQQTRMPVYERETLLSQKVQENPQRRSSARQERYADRQTRVDVADERPQKQQQQRQRELRDEEDYYRSEQYNEPRRGIKRKLEGAPYVREEPEGYFCGGVENDEESVMIEYEATKNSAPRNRRISYSEHPKQIYSQTKNSKVESANHLDLADDSEESLSPIPRDSDNEKPFKATQQSSLKKSTVSPYQDRKENQIPLGKPLVAPRRDSANLSEEKSRSRRRSSRSRNRPALGGGELVYTGGLRNANDYGNLPKKPIQTFGKEQRQGGSVPRRVSKEKGNIESAEFVFKDENSSMRNSRGFVEPVKPQYQEVLLGSSEKKANQRRFLNNEDELSDFDFEVNKVEIKVDEMATPEVGRKKRMKQSRGEEDSVTKAFDLARYENSDRKTTVSQVNRDKGTLKTEMVLNGNFGARRRMVGR